MATYSHMPRPAQHLVPLGAALLLSCVPSVTSMPEDAGPDGAADAAVLEQSCEVDRECDDRIACTIDHCEGGLCVHNPCADCCPEGTECVEGMGCGRPPTPCSIDADCHDGTACTLDRCSDGESCQQLPQDELCGIGEICMAALGCIPTPPSECDADEDCQPASPCLGEWYCDPEFACQLLSPPDCDDGDDCTDDLCDAEAGGCVHPPRDRDEDGFGDLACGGDDCDDSDPARHPGADERCDDADDDCDGVVDEDCCVDGEECVTGCGTTGSVECLPDGSEVCHPPDEVCNGEDDDCDGSVDDGFECALGASTDCAASCGSAGTASCLDTCVWGECSPPAETCSGADDDCDGLADDGFECVLGASEPCAFAPDQPGHRDCGPGCHWGACLCAPGCAGRECGDDGCGGSCGSCIAPSTCNADGLCECVPDCGTRECGMDPVCGTLSCGTCPSGSAWTCIEATGECHCVPDCSGRECGMDPACGTMDCGTCPAGHTCGAGGTCSCVPDCSGRECGLDPCGLISCGTCGLHRSCSPAGLCECDFVECSGTCCADGQVCHAGACCTRATCADPTGPCVSVSDGCGGTMECGDCSSFPCGEVFSDALIPAERDSFTFVASAGDVLDIVMRETSGGYYFAPTMELYSPSGALVATASDGGTARIRDETLTESGTFTIFAFDEALDTAGEYDIAWYRQDQPVCGPTPIACADVLSGSLALAEKDAFTLDGSVGDVIDIVVRETAGGYYFAPTVDLYSSEGTLIRSVVDGATAEMRGETLPYTGSYTVFVYDEWLDTPGSYNISWHRMSAPTC